MIKTEKVLVVNDIMAGKNETLPLKEKDVLKAGLAAAQHHPKVAWAYRINVGGMKVGNRFIRFGWKGMADVTGQLKDGRRLEIEFKNPFAHTEPERLQNQIEFLGLVNRHGGVAFFASSVDDVIAKLDAL